MINIKTSNVLITGAAGFIGSQLANSLVDSGMPAENLMLVDNLEYGHLHNLNQRARGSFIKADCLGLKLGGFTPDVIFHFAGISSLPECESNPSKAYQYNVTAAVYMLDMARAHGARMMFASTSAIYERDPRATYTEDIQEKNFPKLVYPQTKLAAELACRTYIENYNLKVCICRFANVFGAHQDFTRPNPPFTSYLIKQLLSGDDIILYNDDPETLRDYIYVEDLLMLITKAIEFELCGAYNITSSKCYSTIDIMRSLENVFKKKIQYIKGDPMKFWDKYPQLKSGKKFLSPDVVREEIFKRSNCSNIKLLKELNLEGYKFIEIEEGLLKIVKFQERFNNE